MTAHTCAPIDRANPVQVLALHLTECRCAINLAIAALRTGRTREALNTLEAAQ